MTTYRKGPSPAGPSSSRRDGWPSRRPGRHSSSSATPFSSPPSPSPRRSPRCPSSRSPSSSRKRPTPRARSRRLHQARRPSARRGNPRLPHHRPLHPSALPGRLQERSPGRHLRRLARPGEQGRRPRLPRPPSPRASQDPVGRPDRRRPRRPHPGEVGAEPDLAQLEFSDIDIVVAGSMDSIMMVEGGALEISEEEMSTPSRSWPEGDRRARHDAEELIKKFGKARR
jgi:hypothetical protein